MNNGKALVLQSANGEFQPPGQWNNCKGFIGFQQQDLRHADRRAASTRSRSRPYCLRSDGRRLRFSPFGFTGMYAGFGDTSSRAPTQLSSIVSISQLPRRRLRAVGGYDQGNGSASMWQGQIGGDFNLYGGILSLDSVGSYAKDGVTSELQLDRALCWTKGPDKGQILGCVNGIPTFYNTDDLKATLSNNTASSAREIHLGPCQPVRRL